MPQASPLPNTLGEVVSRCQSLLAGNTASVGLYTRAYLVPFINQAYEMLQLMLKNASGKNLEAVVECLTVPAGTSSLYPLQQYGDPTANPPVQPGALVGLTDPIRLWVKTAGALPQFYTPANGPRETLPNVQPPGLTPSNFSVVVTWAWIGEKLFITPVAGPVDIQVYGRFNPPRLVSDTDQLVIYNQLTSTLAAATCAWTGIERSNTTILQGCETQAQAGADNVVADLIRGVQRIPRRLAKIGTGGCGFCGWGWASNG